MGSSLRWEWGPRGVGAAYLLDDCIVAGFRQCVQAVQDGLDFEEQEGVHCCVSERYGGGFGSSGK
jgi:hypothetical protein